MLQHPHGNLTVVPGRLVIRVKLERTVDILSKVAERRRPDQVIVGFAAETENLLDNAQGKLDRKKLDLIVANNARMAMGATDNQVTLISANGTIEELPLMTKDEVADRVLDWIAEQDS